MVAIINLNRQVAVSVTAIMSSSPSSSSTTTAAYDVIVVGAGIAGSALACALSKVSKQNQRPLRVLLLERSLAQPDRIVGELLQPGGVHSLQNLGLESCLEGIDAVPAYGYCVIDEDGRTVHIPYPNNEEGRSFHHGRFIMKLREAAINAESVEVLEGTVTGLIESATGRVEGVRVSVEKQDKVFHAPITIVADGCFSNLRGAVLGSNLLKPVTKSHFVGLVLENAKLPIPKHGTVVFVKGFGPVLLYQISNTGGSGGCDETRLLVDVKAPLPANLEVCLLFVPALTFTYTT
jgi:squalene monooxygenase